MFHLLRPLGVALVATIGDFVWFEYGVSHTTLHGVLHGAALLLAVGLAIGHAGHVAGRPGALWKGALGGILAGIAGALAFYAVIRPLGYLGALIAAWAFTWLVMSMVAAWTRGASPLSSSWLVRGLLAALLSGITFYLVSGIWTEHAPEGGRNYVWHLIAWTIAWAPGMGALTLADDEMAR
jgi:hypothetical protein